MATAVSTIANGGTYIKPRVVKKVVDSKTGEIKEIEPVKKERVISEETSKKVLSMMEPKKFSDSKKSAIVLPRLKQ